ncbi:GNAT family N-acyltransferase [Hydrogenophaga sp. PAMC20947]|uniref:GNAT family N-acetyltransferase n=1 Tax=Hydrogenophaga sp. PAMC20947 TaxID=2565558 RepID=UPI00109D976E|nr:GNAT family N-acyltransferase [Hydrogenophaga sp. PAMC20947]QCB45614.1 GNAT family N-acetyltransferase [Hydrogenophaga sp. PAMC20947]
MDLFTSLRRTLSFEAQTSTYRLRMCSSPEELKAIQRLRFVVFNLELREGLSASYQTGLDQDPFDEVCEHLLVEHAASRTVVGTYRMQTGEQAKAHQGYYCSGEFDLAPYEALRAEFLELGRACIHPDHRNFSVLSMLWRGIVQYAHHTGTRYLLGCSSLTSQDPAVGLQGYRTLQPQLAPEHLRTLPLAGMACQAREVPNGALPMPKLLSAYLALGAWICGPPAIDTQFKTIDFLTLMDLQSPEMAKRRKRFGID